MRTFVLEADMSTKVGDAINSCGDPKDLVAGTLHYDSSIYRSLDVHVPIPRFPDPSGWTQILGCMNGTRSAVRPCRSSSGRHKVLISSFTLSSPTLTPPPLSLFPSTACNMPTSSPRVSFPSLFYTVDSPASVRSFHSLSTKMGLAAAFSNRSAQHYPFFSRLASCTFVPSARRFNHFIRPSLVLALRSTAIFFFYVLMVLWLGSDVAYYRY